MDTKKCERLYLPNFNYNLARILTTLEKIVISKGGKVKPAYKTALITDRTLEEILEKYRNKIDKLEKASKKRNDPHDLESVINRYETELKELETINNEAILVTHQTYITFVLDGYIYSYSGDENPFFDFSFRKTPVRNDNTYNRDTYYDIDKKEWLEDSFYKSGCSNDLIYKMAFSILEMLLNARESETYRESKKQRVPNTYNNGYHYETVYKPTRYEKIDF